MITTRRTFLAACGAAVAAARRLPGAAVPQPIVREWLAPFPALHQRVNGHPLVFLDSAATTLRPRPVIEAISSFYATDNANPSRVHTLAGRAADHLARARQIAARFVNAADPSEIVFVRGTTEGLNLIASSWAAPRLTSGDEIVLTVAEHASNLMPWTRAAREASARVRVLDVDGEGRLRLGQLPSLLSPRTKVVAFSHVSNVLGYVNEAREICDAARRAGAISIIDGAQGAPHVPIDVQALGCDFYVFSGHKLLGPMATGVVWAKREHLDAMRPYHVGSNMAHDVELDTAQLEHGAQKFQAGTPDVAGPVGLAAALELLGGAADRLRAHDDALVRHGLARLGAIPRVRIIGPQSPGRRVPVFTFVVAGMPAAAVAKALDARGIAVRAGDMAALPLLKRLGTSTAVRASAYVYSVPEDFDRLAEALDDITK